MSQGCALLILRSKGQGHGAWLFENGFRTITDSVINLWSWNFIHLLTMSQGCALLILRSKGQRSRSWRMVIWKWFPDDNWLCNQPMIMKLHTLTHHESRMRPIDFEVQRSRSWRMVIWKWFPDDNWLCNQPMIMKLHTLTPHESRMCPIDFGVKRSTVKVMAHGYLKMVHRNNGCRFEFVGVGGGPVLLQQYFQYAFICCPYMLPLLFENGFRTITDSIINLWSWNFIHLLTMSQGCALLILRSKGQRSRSWRMVIWKWFPDDNWLCNPPMIMKLHTLAPHESRMCPIDFGVKRSKVKVMAHGYLKMVSGR